MTYLSLFIAFFIITLSTMGQIRDPKLSRKIALSQEEVYNDINIHIGWIETAGANLSVSTLSALCKYFKIQLSEFHKLVEKQ